MKMKKTKILGLVLALIVFFTNLPFGSGIVYAEGEDDVAIIAKNFPDAKFRQYLKQEKDTITKDGVLSRAEREAVTEIDVSYSGSGTKYKNLVGLNYFPNLEKLTCTGNDISELNLSENKILTYLDCSDNKIKNLNISQNKDLTYLNCSDNYLNSNIDVSNNTELIDLICGRNGDMKLNLENNTKLENLDLSGGRIPTIDLSKNKELRTLKCNGAWLTKLDLSENKNLKELYCKDNSIQDLDLSNNLELDILDCGQNSLGSLDLSSNKNITNVNCSRCGLTELKLPENNIIDELICENNDLTELDLSKSPKLTKLDCNTTKLIKLDLSNNLDITELNCAYSQLTSLDLSENTKLNSFTGYMQNYTVLLLPDAEYIKKSDLPDGFDFAKVDGTPEFATISGESFELEPNADYITYNYKIGVKGHFKLNVKINISHYESIIVSKQPKLEYTEGEELNLSQLEVTLRDGKGNELKVPFEKFQNYNITTNIADKTKLVRATHNNKPITIELESLDVKTNNLTVNERKFNPNNVVKLKVKTQPVKLEYTEGDELNLTGLEVTLIDDFGKEKDVTLDKFNDYQITTEPANKTVLKTTHNATAIIVKKGNATDATNTLKVEKKAFDPDHVKSITVKEQPIKLEYTEGQNLDLTGLEVTLTDDFGKTKDVKFEKFDDYNIKATPQNATELKVADHDGKPVTLTKGNLDPAKTNNLTVKAKVFDPEHIESIAVTTQPKKLIYTAEEPLDLDGLVVTLTDNQGTTKEVPFANFDENGLIATPAEKTALTVADHNGKTVKITKDNLTPAETKPLTVNSKDFDLEHVENIEVLEQPSNLIYTEGEKLNLAGLKVKLIDNNGRFKEVPFEEFDENGITTDPTNGVDLTVAGYNDKTVKITKGNASKETTALTVNPKVFDKEHIASIVVKTQPDNLSYTEGDKLSLAGLEVTLTDNQGLTKDVAFENFAEYGLTATPANDTKLTVDDNDKKIKITKGDVSEETNALTVKAKENPPTPTDPKIIGPVDPSQTPSDINNYYIVKFESSNKEQGTVAEENIVYVPKTLSGKTLADIKAPEVTAKPGYEFEKWSLAKDTAIDKNLTVKAIFKAKGTVNPPVEPSIPSDNIVGPVDSESELYKELDKHKDEYYKLVFDDNDYTRIYVLFVKKGQGIRLTDIAAYAPNVVADEGYIFTGWSPMLYGNTELIENDRFIVAEFEEIGRPYRPYWPDYREERPYRPYRPYRHYEDDRDDRDDYKEEKPVEVNEYDKLEAILFINDTMMQKSINGVVSQVRMDIAPFIYQARTMLPIRYVAESLGFMVTWDANTRTVYLVDKENIVQIPVDSNNIIVNGKAFVSDVKPMIKNNRTMLPVANVARALGLQDGKDILWDAAMKFVTLRRNVLK